MLEHNTTALLGPAPPQPGPEARENAHRRRPEATPVGVRRSAACGETQTSSIRAIWALSP